MYTGSVHSLCEDEGRITVALESRYGDPTFSKLYCKSLRIDRTHGLTNAITYERNASSEGRFKKEEPAVQRVALVVIMVLFASMLIRGSWSARMKSILGLAHGLQYIHHELTFKEPYTTE
jgi:hypothetical protein